LVFLSSCTSFAPTKPNLSIIDKNYVPSQKTEKDKDFLAATSILAELSLKNKLFAVELGKLPELQDGISESESSALEQIVGIYKEMPQEFDKAFEQMYQVGKLDVRKYCSPLQAMFWMVEDGRIKIAKDILGDYSLEKLLGEAWVFDEHFLNLSEKDLMKVVGGIKNEDSRKWYSNAFHDANRKEHASKQLVLDYNKNPNMFSKEAGEIIKNSLVDNVRWNDFDIVTGRLNSPELIDYWGRNNLHYEYYRGDRKTNKSVFMSKQANCYDTTEFTVECLHRAGYKSGNVLVDLGEGHNICYFKDEGKLFIMDNGKKGVPQGIMGPYNSFREIPYTIIEFVN